MANLIPFKLRPRGFWSRLGYAPRAWKILRRAGLSRLRSASHVLEIVRGENAEHQAPAPYSPGPRHAIPEPLHASPDLEKIGDITTKARASMFAAIRNHPAPNYTAGKLGEEAGEVIGAYIKWAEGRGTRQAFEDEAVQLIGVVFRLLVEGDQTILAAARRADQ